MGPSVEVFRSMMCSRTWRSYEKEREPRTGCGGSFDLSDLGPGSIADTSASRKGRPG